jgi:thiamine-monophosphate kinase
MQGAKDCCDRYGVQIVGGDIDYHAELTLVTTGLGTVDRSRLVRRRGSRIGDLICITGTPGRAQAALEGFRQYEKALYEPEPRVREGEILGGAGVTAMMDVSDGLALSLYDLVEANSCGYQIDSYRLPLPPGIPEEIAREMALYGGGDYELLFTCPQEKLPIHDVQYTIIGSVVPDRDVRVDGRVLEKRGYQHTWADAP